MLTPEDPLTWEIYWRKLATHPLNNGDPVCECPTSGETWQYLGPGPKGQCFRHRAHPLTGLREYLHIPEVL